MVKTGYLVELMVFCTLAKVLNIAYKDLKQQKSYFKAKEPVIFTVLHIRVQGVNNKWFTATMKGRQQEYLIFK